MLGVALLLVPVPSMAQHTHDVTTAGPHEHHADTPGLFAPREASGTAWLPDDSPMYGLERPLGDWTIMVHGALFAQYLYEPGDIHRTGGSSNHQGGSVNWGMLAARRPVGRGRIGLRAMISAEPWTVPGCGYLNLLATGELCEGDTIHDRQHAHDLFMELAADYDRPLRGSLRWQVYGGLSGEPALGPAGFPHRLSAMPNPTAPISHHWLDSTHITFGLVTAGVYDRRWKAEVSLFNAREPDEHRTDLDLGPLDSVSGRVTFSPTRRLSLQVSAGHLRAAEAEFPPLPRSDVDRVTASAVYHRSSGQGSLWATTLAYGANSAREFIPGGVLDATTHAGLLESSVTLSDRHTWFGRAELVGKPAHDLHAHEYASLIFTIGKLQGGYVRHLRAWKGIVPGIGATVSASLLPPALAPRYNGRVAPGFGVFLSVRPSRHMM
jgi:hypothetical protein